MLSYPDMRKVCLLMHEAKTCAVFGVGDAYLAGLTFQARMMRAGTNYLTASVDGEQTHLAETLHDGDVGLLLSYSGETTPTIRCARILQKNHAIPIAITADPSSALAKACSLVLTLPASETKYHRIASFFSQTAMDYYLNILYSALYIMDFDEVSGKSID